MNSMTDFFKSKLKQKVAVGKREREEEVFCDEGLRKRKEMAFFKFQMRKYIHKMLKYVAHEMRIIIPVMFYNTMCVTIFTEKVQSSLFTIYL